MICAWLLANVDTVVHCLTLSLDVSCHVQNIQVHDVCDSCELLIVGEILYIACSHPFDCSEFVSNFDKNNISVKKKNCMYACHNSSATSGHSNILLLGITILCKLGM